MTDNQKITEFDFAVGGPVQAKFGTYLPRPADEELLKACQVGEFAYVLASRQIGKSSLMYATAEKLGEAGVKTALVDLNEIGKAEDADTWYFNLIDFLAQNLKLKDKVEDKDKVEEKKKINVETWWDDKSRLTLNRRLRQFLRDVVLEEISKPVVIFIDEIDMTLGFDFADDFFAVIRSIYNARPKHPSYKRLTFVLLGVATPDELIADPKRTPFNIGQAITLRDFTQEECAPFRLAVETKYPDRGSRYFEQIYDWTKGHPYLTQKLCRAVVKWKGEKNLELIDTLVEKFFLSPVGLGDLNLGPIQRSVIGDRRVQEILKIYKQVLQNEEPVDDDEKSLAINRLKLYGLVIAKNDRLEVRNQIYTNVFNLAWADKMLEKSMGLGLPEQYKIRQVLGHGGFATVYLADETQESGEMRQVAVKVLDFKEDSEDNRTNLIEQLEREAATIAKLDHPNIINIFNTQRTETGHVDEAALYISMEYISGGTLRDKLGHNGPLPRDEAVDIVKQIGDALVHAHDQDIIHCDLKPKNILLDTDDKTMRPVLTDFGVAQLLPGDDSGGTIKGTHAYMAPEQWRGETPTPATDVYALALIFFEMLAGRPPFEANLSPTLKNLHLNQPLPPLSNKVPEVGEFFDEALAKATAKEPSKRYQHMTNFVKTVEAANEQVNDQVKRSRAATMFKMAQEANREGDLDAAITIIRTALIIYPGYVPALRLKGKIELDRKQQAYEQERNPASDAGRDYLKILREIADKAWQNKEDQETIKRYKVIKQILDEGHTELSVKMWQEAVNELIKYHQNQGNLAYAKGYPNELEEASNILKRHIAALEALEAGNESQDLQFKRRSLQIKYHHQAGVKIYDKGISGNITEAIPVLKDKIKILNKLATQDERQEAAKDAHQDLENKLKALQIKHHYREVQNAFDKGQAGNITEAIQTLEGEIKSLEDFKADNEIRTLSQNIETLKIEQLYRTGKQAYIQAKENPKNITETMGILRRAMEALQTLDIDKSQDLKNKQTQLQVRVYQETIKAEKNAISKVDIQIGFLHIRNEKIFEHYQKIDQTDQKLIELEPKNEQWPENRRTNLKAEAEDRAEFAQYALNRLWPQYDKALGHYRRILDIDQICKGVAQKLGLDDLQKTIDNLEKKSIYAEAYRDIRDQVERKDYITALKSLNKEFINQGNYEYRDVARLFLGVVYAKKYEGQYPPDWADSIKQKQVRLQKLKETLQPCSETSRQQDVVLTCDKEIKDIEARLKKITIEGEEKDAAAKYLQKANTLWQEADVKKISQQLQPWLQSIANLEVLSQPNDLPGALEFFDNVDEDLKIIEQDQTFDTLKAVQDNLNEAKKELEVLERGEDKQKIEHLEKKDKISFRLLYVTLIMGTFIGLLIAVKVPATQNLFWLSVIVEAGIVLLIGWGYFKWRGYTR